MYLEALPPNTEQVQHMKNIFTIKQMSVALAILVVFGGAAFYIQQSDNEKIDSSFENLLQQESATQALGDGQSVDMVSPTAKKFTHALLGFSFEYPTQFSISSFGSAYDDSGETVLLQGGGGEKGLQVLITPFDEDIVLTEERIHRDIPDLVMSDVSTRILGTGAKTIQTIVFTSTNSLMGKSKEAWFVRDGRLYQISAPYSAQDVLTEALDSWGF